ncbi:MAG: hypothetical protein ACI9F9_002017 [Candidatus Paceibacteria bacterium]|jgi:hypothetical protein
MTLLLSLMVLPHRHSLADFLRPVSSLMFVPMIASRTILLTLILSLASCASSSVCNSANDACEQGTTLTVHVVEASGGA